jgi:FixJ family two-component response regulator
MVEGATTIFIIDDDASVRTSLSRLLRASEYHTEEFHSAESYLSRETHRGIGCIILDVRMDGKSGIALQEELNQRGNTMPIIFLSGHGDIPTTVRAIKAGAGDFLQKPVDEKTLLSTIEQALETHRKRCAECESIEKNRKRFSALTPREYEVMRWVLTGMLNKQIAYELGISEKTVKVHRGEVMKKLHVGSVAELVRLAEAAGITPAV